MRRPISSIHPVLYFFSVWLRRTKRYLTWYFDKKKYAGVKITEKLPYRVKKHSSVLVRKLGNSDLQLQYNKVVNLKIAAAKINGIIIKPGETFSFCKTVGLTTNRKGYLPGMLLSNGEAKTGTGGGICQIANLIHWLVIHSPLTLTERHHHSFDPFPDDRRVIPFGSGASVYYNYLDYQFTNTTPYTFQINLWFTEKCLEGDLRISQQLSYVYHVFEKGHQFLKINGEYFRKNEIWRDKIVRYRDTVLETELVTRNFAKVKYIPENYIEDYN
ncbi:MAG: VanW family protein [Peptococcaceae bacterium]